MKCDCARCRGMKTADPKWGFDRSKVAKVLCLICNTPIGRSRFVLDVQLARFGTMFVIHQRCAGK